MGLGLFGFGEEPGGWILDGGDEDAEDLIVGLVEGFGFFGGEIIALDGKF